MIELITTCVQASEQQVGDYDRTEMLVELQTIKNMIDLADYYALARSLGYALQKEGGLMMHQDWHLKFGLGEFNGESVICVHHSAIHHFYRFSPKQIKLRTKPLYQIIDDERHKYCKGCDDYFPATKEFFYRISKQSDTRLETLCKPCYNERYKQPKRLTSKTYTLRSAA